MVSPDDWTPELIAAVEARTVVCQWFALCDHPATQGIAHPTLGNVPTCDRCAARIAENS